MKTISKKLKTEIEDALAEGLIALPAEVIEKDIHVTDVLGALANTIVETEFSLANYKKGDPRPRHLMVGSTLVFAGGTCLSKAHGLISRMSEDIDIKIVLHAPPNGYTRKLGGSDKQRLTNLQASICQKILDMGFTVSEVDEVDDLARQNEAGGNKNPRIRDARRYYHLSLDYKSAFFTQNVALRPQIKLELIHRPIQLDHETKAVGYLFDKLLGRPPSIAVQLACISVPETLAEKVLSMLRRCAWNWFGNQHGEIDSTLVRHIYDVGQIINQMPGSLEIAKNIFQSLVEKDGEEFGRQYPEFRVNSREILLQALHRLEHDPEQIKNYNEKLVPLVYDTDMASYENAYARFKGVAEQLIDTLPVSVAKEVPQHA